MDAIALLVADHNRLRGLFTRFKEADEDTVRGSLSAEIRSELRVHTAIEEDRFYPWASGLSEEIRTMIAEGVEEHHVVKVLMREIGELSPDQPEWAAKMTVLIENVEHHAEEEETELFASVRGASKAEDRKALGTAMEEEKQHLGAAVLADKIDLTTAELKELAREQQIPGRSSMDHDELAATVAPRR